MFLGSYIHFLMSRSSADTIIIDNVHTHYYEDSFAIKDTINQIATA